ncbi:MAG: beta-propeller domain-containing protein [Hyphomonadaceae bacterium]|nr:beta-propeller domain-containing protein [Hyphomonadaceae bacterium]
MAKTWVAAIAAVALVGTATAQTESKPPSRPQPQEPQITEPPVWNRLERFESEAELLQYVRDIRRLQYPARRAAADGVVVTGSAIPLPPPPPPPPPAPAAAMESAASAAPVAQAGASQELTSITNVQTQGVDEGGIVKMVGRFLVILQDGRLFVADTRPGGQAGLSLTGRTNVYRNPRADTWYDELLISGNRILVTGYSYREAASEITVFTIDETGALTREATYYISSNDYYDPENYSTRLVNGNLVIYTPLNLMSVNPDQPMRWPLVRRWLRDGDHRAVTSAGLRLFDARDIYKPITPTRTPMIHSVSVCPLGDVRSGDELDCSTTAFVGPPRREFFVSTSDIYLWVTPNRWGDPQPCDGPNASAVPATLYQVPLSGATPRALFARGEPTSQLAMDASATEFRALLSWNTSGCGNSDGVELRYFRTPFNALSATPRAAPARAYTETPRLDDARYEVRFTDTHVVYGGRDQYHSFPQGGENNTGRVVAVSTARPTNTVTIDTPHEVMRIERVGNDIALTGYRSDEGLSLSFLELTGRPRIASTTVLRGRYESENRSHAFNSIVNADQTGLMGLPTVARVKEGGRWVWRSNASDLSFVSFDAVGRLAPVGELAARPNATDSSYRCEVSCVDWYGNSRALYIGSRVLALSATELIEGEVREGRIAETRRLNLSAPPPRS